MKKLLTIAGLLISTLLFSQAPQSIHYQAVIRDANGAVLSNQSIDLKVEILQGPNTYTEIQTLTTNNLGLVNFDIGTMPAPNSILFTDIDWAGGNASLLTWYDPTNTQSNWQFIGSSSIASVPYALYAENGFSGDFNDLTNVPNLDTSNTNELQVLSLSGDTLFLSSGGFVVLPSNGVGTGSNNGQAPSLVIDSIESIFGYITVYYSISNSGSSMLQSHGIIYSDSTAPNFDNSEHLLSWHGKKGHYFKQIGYFQPSQTIYIKACASNSQGTTLTPLVAVTTGSYVPPTVSHPNDVFFTNDSSVHHSPVVIDCGNDPNCSVYWVLKDFNSVGMPTFGDSLSISIPYGTDPYNWNVSHNSSYKFRLYIENSIGSSYSVINYDSLFIPYLIGDFAFGGIVAYIKTPNDIGYDPNYYHGIIIDTADLYPNSWSCSNTVQSALDSSAFQGLYNGNVINNYCANFPTSYLTSAFGLTYNLNLNGFADWSLPTPEDINLLQQNFIRIFQYFTGTYYTSFAHFNTQLSSNIYIYGSSLVPSGQWNVPLTTKAKAIRYY